MHTATTPASLLLLGLLLGTISAAEPVTRENLVDPGPNVLDEPLAQAFSLDKALHFIDSAALQWQQQRECFTCHTNIAYLYTRPRINDQSPAHREVRAQAESLVRDRWAEQGPRWDAEVVAMAAALALNDAATTGELHPLTREALDRMWTLQREDGGWDWLKCDWPPLESDDHYGATLAAIAVGAAPDEYAKSAAARQGMERLRSYFAAQAPENLHHRAMLLWAATYHDDLLHPAERQSWVDQLLALQKPDGGWALATLGDWRRADGQVQNTDASDGYGTGFVVFILRQAGLDAQDSRIQRGVDWLRSHQRASGRWITRSLNRDNKHFISHAGTMFALLALDACEALPRE